MILATQPLPLGTGLYTPADAAKLLHEQPETVRRWAFGYTRQRGQGYTEHPPLINTDLPEVEGQRAVTFVELVELLYVRAFERAGVSWAVIKEAARVATRLYDSAHPFALKQVYADPKAIYAGLGEGSDGNEILIQLAGHGQQAFPQLVKPYLHQIEFGVDNLAARWWPMGKRAGILVDPNIAFGEPVVEAVRIRARVLADAVAAESVHFGERAVQRVAWTYELAPKHVKTALSFQTWLKAPQ